MLTERHARGARAVPAFAAYLARGFGCARVLGIGFAPEERPEPAWRDLAGVAFEPYPAASEDERLSSSVIACLLDGRLGPGPEAVLARLRTDLDRAPAAVLAVDPDGWRGDTTGLPARGPAQLARWLVGRGLRVAFIGRAARDAADRDRRLLVAVLESNRAPRRRPAPSGFRVAAIVPAYNEEDIIAHTLRDLIGQGIDVYLLDNWSTDATVERVAPFLGRGLLAIERFPAGGPTGTYDLTAILTRVEELGLELEADWLVLHDADERRRSPWPGVSLRDGLYHADRCGFSAIDHMTVNFWPTDDRYNPAYDVEQQLTRFEFSDHLGHFHQRRAWKNTGQRVSLAWTAGHDVWFEGRLVYPYRFLLKHYPIRSQAHGERKVLRERRPRFSPEERGYGWHAQYDALEEGHTFLRDPAELERADRQTLYEKYLIERLSGIGIFTEPPPWATPPR